MPRGEGMSSDGRGERSRGALINSSRTAQVHVGKRRTLMLAAARSRAIRRTTGRTLVLRSLCATHDALLGGSSHPRRRAGRRDSLTALTSGPTSTTSGIRSSRPPAPQFSIFTAKSRRRAGRPVRKTLGETKRHRHSLPLARR